MHFSKIGLSTALFALSMSFGALSAQAAAVQTEARDIQSSKPIVSGVVWDDAGDAGGEETPVEP
jgi:hypothetical protein